jgi:hypothetical protein
MRLGNVCAINALLGQQRLSLHLSHMAHKGPRDTWLRQSPPQRGVEVRSHGTRGNTGALLGREVRSEAAGHMAAPEPSSTRR